MKKPVLNPILNLTLTWSLPAKHSDVFLPGYLPHSLQPSNSPKTYLYTTSVFDIGVELCFMNVTFILTLASTFYKILLPGQIMLF